MKEIKDQLVEAYDTLLFCDGFDEALVGVAHRAGLPTVSCYSLDKMIEILKKDMTEEEAREYLEFNTLSAYVGDHSPVFVELIKRS
jgi:hypothetical protein